jgi:hypothetical protein
MVSSLLHIHTQNTDALTLLACAINWIYTHIIIFFDDMCVYPMYVCMCVHVRYTHIILFFQLFHKLIHTDVCVYVCACVRTYMHTHMYVCTHTHTLTYIPIPPPLVHTYSYKFPQIFQTDMQPPNPCYVYLQTWYVHTHTHTNHTHTQRVCMYTPSLALTNMVCT